MKRQKNKLESLEPCRQGEKKEVEVVYHIGDVHITANLERQEEYKDVLKKTVEKIKEEEREKIVVICGDLFHEKTKVYQEANVIARNFMKELGDICEVIIIAGNHDVCIDNESRTDSIEATLCNLETENTIHYLTENKIYKIKGINFGLTKMTNNEVTKIEKKNKKEIYIALYHGTLYKSRTDEGYNFEDENKIKASNFKDYDYTMLGDIHLHQYMNKEKTIAYSGSLIQQNFGENIKNHGILIWDLKNKTSKLMKIENEYIYKTHVIKNTTNTEIDEIKNKKCRLRLRYKNIELVELLKYEKKIRKKYDIVKLVKEEIMVNEKNEEIKNDTTKKSYIETYKKFSEIKKIKNDEGEINILNKLVDEENKKMDKMKRGIEIYELEFENLVTYGKRNIINFKKLEKLNILTGKNGLGKSALADIILFILYDKFSRNDKGKEILNVRYKNGYGILRLKLNGIKYTIKRTVNKQQTKVHIFKGFFNLDEMNDKITEEEKNIKELRKKNKNVSCGGKKETSQQIIDMFGSYEEMTLTSIILQIGGNFVDVKDTKKKDLMIEIMGLKLYDEVKKECEKVSKDYSSNKLKELFRNLTDIDYEKKLKELDDIIKNKESYSVQIEKNIREITKEKNILEYKIGKVNTSANIDTKEKNYAKITEEIISIKNNKKNIKKEIKNIILSDIVKENNKSQEKINELLTKITKCEINDIMKIKNEINKFNNEKKILISEINKIKITDDIDTMKNLQNLKKNIETSLNKTEIINEKLNIYKNSNKELIKHKFSNKCNCCIENKKIHDDIGYLKEIKKLEKEKNECMCTKNDLIEIEEKISQQEIINENKNKMEILKLKKKINEDGLDKLKNILKTLNENEKTNIKIIKIKEKIKNNNEQLNKIKLYEEIEITEREKIKEADKIKNEIDEHIKNIENIKRINILIKEEEKFVKIQSENNETLKLMTKELGTFQKENEMQNKIKNEIKNAQTTLNYYLNILNVYSNGLIKHVMNEQMQLLEKKINNALRNLTDYEIKIIISNKDISFYKIINPTAIDNEIRYLNACQLCGYERVAFNLAVRIALNSMSTMTKNNFLIIDEGFSAADNVNIHKFPQILELIKKEYEVCILISHIDDIKNQKGKLINIEYNKITTDSKIQIV